MGCFLFLLGVEQVLYQIKQKIPRCCNRNSDNLMTTKHLQSGTLPLS